MPAIKDAYTNLAYVLAQTAPAYTALVDQVTDDLAEFAPQYDFHVIRPELGRDFQAVQIGITHAGIDDAFACVALCYTAAVIRDLDEVGEEGTGRRIEVPYDDEAFISSVVDAIAELSD